MMQDVSLALLLAAVIIVIGALGSILFRKTGIPDMIFLVLLGLLFGPVSGIILLKDIEPLAPYLAMLALIIILLDGGINLNLRQTIRQSPRAILLATLGFILSVAATAFFARLTLGFSWSEGLLLGSILGGSSSIVVVSLAQKIGVSEGCSTTLVIESAMTDILCTIAALTLLGAMVSGFPPVDALALAVGLRFLIGASLGVSLGFVWLGVLSRSRNEPYRYMLTLAVLFLGYLASESLGGSGALSVLTFGIILGSEAAIKSLLRRSESPVICDESFRKLETEIAFLIKTFFFVYLGLMVSFTNILLAIYGLLLSLLLLFTHYVAVGAATLRSSLGREKAMMSMIYSRGLAAAVLAVLPQQYGIPNSSAYVPITLAVILVTAIITTIGAYHFSPKRSAPQTTF